MPLHFCIDAIILGVMIIFGHAEQCLTSAKFTTGHWPRAVTARYIYRSSGGERYFSFIFSLPLNSFGTALPSLVSYEVTITLTFISYLLSLMLSLVSQRRADLFRGRHYLQPLSTRENIGHSASIYIVGSLFQPGAYRRHISASALYYA